MTYQHPRKSPTDEVVRLGGGCAHIMNTYICIYIHTYMHTIHSHGSQGPSDKVARVGKPPVRMPREAGFIRGRDSSHARNHHQGAVPGTCMYLFVHVQLPRTNLTTGPTYLFGDITALSAFFHRVFVPTMMWRLFESELKVWCTVCEGVCAVYTYVCG